MKLKIAIPDNPLYAALTAGAADVTKNFSAEIYTVSERQCGELLLANRVDIALVSPRGYGMGVAKADYKIIPGPALALHAYTGVASLYFRENARDMESCATSMDEDFLLIAAKIVLNEKYGFDPAILQRRGGVAELLREADIAVAYGTDEHIPVSLDISEEWFDTFEMPMPLAFWVSRNDDEDYPPESLREIVAAMAREDMADQEDIQEHDREGMAVEGRIGRISRRWDAETEDALTQTLQLLYFHQYFSEIPAVKILGRD